MKTFARILILTVVLLCLTAPVQAISASATNQLATAIVPDLGGAASGNWLLQFWQNPLAPTYSGCGGIASPPHSNTSFEQEVFNLTNARRAANNPPLPPLKRVDLLDTAAQYFAVDMAQENYFPADHATYDRLPNGALIAVPNCGMQERVVSYYGNNWASIAENIANGQTTPAEVMDSWMNSTGHRANILSTDNWELGVAYAPGVLNKRYWVQDFGKRFDIYPLIINSDAVTTTTTNVTVYIYGSWTSMRFRNDGGTWESWRTFKNSSSWTINNTEGIHTVEAELTDGSKNVTTSDTIRYVCAANASTIYSTNGICTIPPGAFLKSTPANGATGQPATLTLTWDISNWADRYEYCYNTSNVGTCSGSWVSAGNATSANLSGLSSAVTYYWQVRAVNSLGNTEAIGGWWSFTIQTGSTGKVYLPLVRR
jgi:uncharacterized protein YkwD